MATMRATSVRKPASSRQASAPACGSDASMFIGHALRSAPKPECISAQMLRARARDLASAGHSACCGNFSARYSQIASESHTAKPSSTSTGTFPVGLSERRLSLNVDSGPNESKRTMTSSNAIPACLSRTQGRIDHDE